MLPWCMCEAPVPLGCHWIHTYDKLVSSVVQASPVEHITRATPALAGGYPALCLPGFSLLLPSPPSGGLRPALQPGLAPPRLPSTGCAGAVFTWVSQHTCCSLHSDVWGCQGHPSTVQRMLPAPCSGVTPGGAGNWIGSTMCQASAATPGLWCGPDVSHWSAQRFLSLPSQWHRTSCEGARDAGMLTLWTQNRAPCSPPRAEIQGLARGGLGQQWPPRTAP